MMYFPPLECLTEFNEEEFIRNRQEEGWNKATAEMQPIIDRMEAENRQKDAEIARQATEIAELRTQVAELQAST